MKTGSILLIILAMMLAACGDNTAQKEAESLLEKADGYFKKGEYDVALSTIDSLRKAYPNALETRKKALTLYQDISLKQAQEDLARTDSLLQAADRDYQSMKAKVDEHKKKLRATAEELTGLTLAKMKLDSLKVRFDVQCAKIKYIHKKQKE